MSNNPFANWTTEMVEEHNRRVAGGRSVIADAFEHIQVGKVTPQKNEPLYTEKSIPHNARRGEWVEFGGKKFYARSKWEISYAAYLTFLKDHGYIKEWAYEPKTFWFEGIRRGTNNYKPDFLVTFMDDTTEYREVKGYLDRKSKTKLKRMKKYFPDVKVRLIDGAWFKQHGPKMATIVPGWRKKK